MRKINNTLWKKSTKGKLLEWTMYVDGDSYFAEHGQVGGQLVKDKPTVAKAKNVGRSNETTPEEQAVLEAQAKYKKKIEIRGYVEDQADVDKVRFEVTLAHKFQDHGKKLGDAVVLSPKMDGMRCYITKDGAFSRNHKPVVTIQHILDDLVPYFEKFPNHILDGELYTHALLDDFNTLMSYAKKTKLSSITDEEWEGIRTLEYHIFDAYMPEILATGDFFTVRNNLLKAVFDKKPPNEIIEHEFQFCKLVPQVSGWKRQVQDYHDKYVAEGYEGVMIRNPMAGYEMKRSYKLLKYKEFDDDEFEIVDVLEGIGNRSGMAGNIVIKLADGRTCEAGLRGNAKFFTKLLNQKQDYIGKQATVRYQGLTPDGILRFPVMVAIRDYE